MKLCINCYTENPEDEVFCSKCGMSLMGAPTPEEARNLAEERQRRRKQPLTASGIVYVFADHFVTPWPPPSDAREDALGIAISVAGMLDLMAGCPSIATDRWQRRHWSVPVQVPYSDQHVAVRDLGRKLLEAAFVSLGQEGHISLSVEKTRTLFASQEVVTMKREKEENDLPPSLERLIMELLAHSPQGSPLMKLVTRVAKAEDREIGGQDRLLGGKAYYCDGVAYVVMKALTDMGWLERGGPVKEAAALLAAMAGQADTVKARLESFAAENPDLHARLVSELMQLA